MKQHTIGREVSCRGVGLHSGRRVTMVLHPAAPGAGISFRRSDRRAAAAAIPASWRNVVPAPLCTMLAGVDGVRVRTVEHLMGALYACEIDNAVIELDSEEVPILDGSAAPLVRLVESAGVAQQDLPRRFLRVLKPVDVREGKTHLSLRPADQFSIDVTLAMPGFGLLRWAGDASPDAARREIAPARTFGRLKEALPALLLGRLGGPVVLRGASLSNAVLAHGSRVLNRGGLRFPDEFVRHRVLDALGDLALAEAPLIGHVSAVRTSHRFNHRLLAALFADAAAWCWTECPQAPATSTPPVASVS